MGRRRSTSSVSTLQVTGSVIVMLIVAILLALIFAPEKPVAPPTSVLTYEERPIASPQAPDMALPDEPAPPTPSASGPVLAADPGTPEPQPEPETEAMPFEVTGRVVDEETGEPVAQAYVSIKRTWTPDEASDWQSREQDAMAARERDLALLESLRIEEGLLRHQASHRTGRQGRFAVKAPREGEYHITVRASGYLSPEGVLASVSEASPKSETTIRLGRGASISGRVIEAGSSRGAANVPVERRAVNASSTMSHDRSETDEDGHYTLSGLTPGEYEITLDLSDAPYEAGKVLPYRRVKITNPTQKLTNINFTLEPAGVVWGYVTTPDDEPVRSDIVLCTSESLVTQFVKAAIKQKPPINGHSGSKDGYYELVGVPLNQEWNIYATSKNYPPQLSEPFVLTTSHRSARIDVFMFAGTNIYGYVTDTKGNAIQGAEVVCVPSIGKILAPMENPHAFRDAKTDKNGDFVITQVPAGNYQIYAIKQGYKYSATGQPVFPDGYNDIDNVHMILQGVEEGEHEIYGTVVDMAGNGLGGVQLGLAGLSTESMNSTERKTTTDNSGRFLFEGVEVGVYQLFASLEGYAPRQISKVLIDRENTITMSPGSIVRGVVLVKETNRPPDYYTVSATPITAQGTLSSMVFTDHNRASSGSFNNPDGSFELTMAGGNYRLEAKAGKYTPGRTELSVEPGSVTDGITLFVSEDGAVINGRVRVTDGSSPQGAQVFLTEAGTSAQEVIQLAFSGNNNEMVQTVGEDGLFQFTDKPAGNYNVIAKHPSYASAESGAFYLAEGDSHDVGELRLGSGGSLEGYVFQDDAPVPGAMVVVMAQGQPRTANADDAGWYEITELPPGLAQAVVMPSGMTDVTNFMGLGNVDGVQTVAVEIVSGQATRYDFGSSTGTRLVGQCSPAPANPLVGGAVVLRAPGSPMVPRCGTVEVLQLSDGVTAAINGQGAFTIDDVPPGNWQVDVYYAGPGMNFFELTYRNSALVEVTGAEESGEVFLEVEAPSCD